MWAIVSLCYPVLKGSLLAEALLIGARKIFKNSLNDVMVPKSSHNLLWSHGVKHNKTEI